MWLIFWCKILKCLKLDMFLGEANLRLHCSMKILYREEAMLFTAFLIIKQGFASTVISITSY